MCRVSILWHLAEQDEWEQARGEGVYRRSTRGASLERVGFIHCSAPEQLPGVVAALYSDVVGDYVILEMERSAVEATGLVVRDEPAVPGDPQASLFPHVYGPIPVGVVARVRPARIEQGVLSMGEQEGHEVGAAPIN